MPKFADLLERAAVDKLAQLRMALGQHQAPEPPADMPEPTPVIFRDGCPP